jgi:hypothetical protein
MVYRLHCLQYLTLTPITQRVSKKNRLILSMRSDEPIRQQDIEAHPNPFSNSIYATSAIVNLTL